MTQKIANSVDHKKSFKVRSYESTQLISETDYHH